jgi:hypothetical protein
MKKQFVTALFFCLCATLSVHAQQNDTKKKALTAEISFKSQAEKEANVKEQEARIAVNKTDPTYPKDVLEKEIKALEATKKAVILTTKKN